MICGVRKWRIAAQSRFCIIGDNSHRDDDLRHNADEDDRDDLDHTRNDNDRDDCDENTPFESVKIVMACLNAQKPPGLDPERLLLQAPTMDAGVVGPLPTGWDRQLGYRRGASSFAGCEALCRSNLCSMRQGVTFAQGNNPNIFMGLRVL